MKKIKYKKTFIVLLILSPIILTSLFIGINYYLSPKYSLYIIKKSLEQHDSTTFQKYVDIDNISTSLFDQLSLFVEENIKNNNEGNWGTNIGFAIAKTMKSQLSLDIKKGIIKYIETENMTDKQSLDTIWDRIGKNKIIKIGSIKKQNKIANVNLIITYPKYNNIDLDFNILMRDKGLYWEVADLPDISKILKNIDELEEKRISDLNAPIIKEFKNTLSIQEFQKRNYSTDEWNISKNIHYEFKVKNISKNNITAFSGTVTLTDTEKTFKNTISINNNAFLTPQSYAFYSKDDNIFSTESSNLYYMNDYDIDHILNIDSITFDDKRQIKLYKKWSD